ncbi:SMI1/KNR4 family protein [Streptomyces fructofermentans]|uniref:Knr4/Smi1-like domain-containing protein n=1 Tax=Streptomyces fructofermentans TaxID=152141 RepID=A0A918NE60_9ACTN|nr:SMI1/KNR4 family protein [Streptomyces fructofermentans]GGX63829.1 hypothetical protein GCM10010515_34430 [Streptomyces fructofermentans]
MTQKFDLAGSLARGVGDRGQAWTFIRDYAADWLSPIEDGDGWPESELAAAEERLGVRLPAVLREAYALFGRRRDLVGNHDRLLAPAALHLDEAGRTLVFRHENQGAATWGVPLGDPRDDDPAVFIRLDLADKAAERWEGWLDRLSLGFLELVLSESLNAGGEVCDFLDPDDETAELLEEHCVPLAFPAYPTSAEEQATRWFLGPDVLIRSDDGMAVLARGRTAGDLERVRDLIPGDWLDDYR